TSRGGGIRIAELARRTGTPKETIHYYLREGLLKRPRKTSRNMAYYDESHVEQLTLIKRLQSESYLPLSIIKKVLREGKLTESARKADLAGELIGRQATRAELEPVTREHLRDKAALTDAELERYEEAGLLRPRSDREGEPPRYSWEDV